MTPYFFRGSVLIAESVISYNEFMAMTVKDFERLEAFMIFKNDYKKNREKAVKNNKTKAELSNLNTIDIKKLGFSDEQLQAMY